MNLLNDNPELLNDKSDRMEGLLLYRIIEETGLRAFEVASL